MPEDTEQPTVSDEEEYESEEEEEDDEEYGDLSELLTGLLATDDDNICTAVLKVGNQLETTNKILVKILAHLKSSSA